MSRRGLSDSVCRQVVELTTGIRNESPLHTALLLNRAKAMRHLGLFDAAKEVLKEALTDCYKPELIRAFRYERGLVYEAVGRKD